METGLVPGNAGRDCPTCGELCDECDYLVCCTNFGGLCDKCFAENPACQWKAPHRR